jgi:HEAT repeat protein
MKAMRRTILCLLAVVVIPFLACPSVLAQEPSPAEKAIEQFDGALKEKNDEAIAGAIGVLIDAYIAEGTSDAEKSKIVDSLGKALKYVGPDGQITMKAAQGLGGMGEDAAKVLASVMRDRRFRKEESLKPAYLSMIRALGATKSEREYKTLVDLLNDKDFDVIAAAAEALGNYDDVKLTTRKRIAEALIKTLDSAYNAAEADPRNTTLRRKYEVIGLPLFGALQKVTGATVGSAPEWRKWYNDNKKKRWD